MKKILFYSHDTYGLGNIRRTLSMCKALIDSIPDVTILVVSGSPIVHSFRIPEGIDYVKLPCLTRTEAHGYSAKFLDDEEDFVAKLRSDVILCTVANFKPDVMMVDKKPFGVQNELQSTLAYLHEYYPNTKLTLILRDILDSSETTQDVWARQGYAAAIEKYYTEISVLGSPEVFDPREEYGFSPKMKAMTRFWGYIRREPGLKDRAQVRQELGLTLREPLVLLTAGGGEDGTHLFESYFKAYGRLPAEKRPSTLGIFGPEMVAESRLRLEQWAEAFPRIHTLEFSSDLMSYMDAADVVVGMGGYGTVCEILTLNKAAVIIPRVEPVKEQWIRARRMEELGLFQMIHPARLTPTKLMEAVLGQLARTEAGMAEPTVDLNALQRLSENMKFLLRKKRSLEPDFSNTIESVFTVSPHSGFSKMRPSPLTPGLF